MSDELFVLAFDHRRSLMTTFFGVDGEPTPEDEAKARLLKNVVWSGLRRAIEDGLPTEQAGALVDATYGHEVIAEAGRLGVRVATPIEASGESEFTFEVPAWKRRLEELDPAWAKVLVRFNPDGDTQRNERQARALREVSDHCRATGRGFMFELLVPPESGQLEAVSGHADRYDREIRPGLTILAIGELQAAGVEPDVWKLEGLDRPGDAEAVAAAARAGGRDHVGCVVLGRGADLDAVERWLRVAASVPGFEGFAVGRSIWWDPGRTFFEAGAGEAAATAAATEIAHRFRRLVDAFLAARA